MKKITSLLVSFLLILSLGAFAVNGQSDYRSGKYEIPADSDVLLDFNIIEEEVAIYPMGFSILVWNMFKGAKVNWLKDFQDLSNGKEILILQEVFTSKKMIQGFSETKDFNYVFATSFMDTSLQMKRNGVATAAKQISKKSSWQRSFYREPVIKTPKMTLFTKYKLAGIEEELLVGNIHAINFVSNKKFKHMIADAAQLLAKHKGPVIFGGDFNTWTKKKTRTMNRIMTGIGFKAVQFSVDFRKKFLGKTLDHIWVKGLNVKSAVAPVYPGSDHNPMEVSLGLF